MLLLCMLLKGREMHSGVACRETQGVDGIVNLFQQVLRVEIPLFDMAQQERGVVEHFEHRAFAHTPQAGWRLNVRGLGQIFLEVAGNFSSAHAMAGSEIDHHIKKAQFLFEEGAFPILHTQQGCIVLAGMTYDFEPRWVVAFFLSIPAVYGLGCFAQRTGIGHELVLWRKVTIGHDRLIEE